ncbi:ran-specific gtpase-activating protein [Phaffia rhodozyma]|uniref:Ran-specific gtpase-activating protein n=1 Tax=Phaffia rhodozyma TaxID=264483 RepID=A0A0F7SY04_PHARH|nr:ran-specific gtpase-activating protein [Phaffia rhodozyma]
MAEEDNSAGAPETEPHFEPVHKLTEQVAVATGEENDTVLFKIRAKLFRFEKSSSEWKERGTGEAKILKPESGKIRLVMRRDKTLKVCANHVITTDMTLSPNIGSDRSWVWNVAADVSEGEPTQETLAIRFANAENAGLFKDAFDNAAEENKSGASAEKASESPVEAAAASESAPVATTEEKPATPVVTPAPEPESKEDVSSPVPAAAVDELIKEEKKVEEQVDVKAPESSAEEPKKDE